MPSRPAERRGPGILYYALSSSGTRQVDLYEESTLLRVVQLSEPLLGGEDQLVKLTATE